MKGARRRREREEEGEKGGSGKGKEGKEGGTEKPGRDIQRNGIQIPLRNKCQVNKRIQREWVLPGQQ